MRRGQGLRVLVVADPREAEETLAGPLRQDGHQVERVGCVCSALKSAREALPDVVILDLEWVGGDGPALVRGIDELSAWRRPFVAALGGRPEESGIDLLLGRPVAVASLRSLLRRFGAILAEVEEFDPAI